jgi:two-component system, chemotaxis family, response regulator WspR
MTYLPASSIGTAVTWQPLEQADAQRDVVATTLAQQGYKILPVALESEVWKALANPPSLLVIYMRAAGEAGYALCQKLRQLPSMRSLPIVFVGDSQSPAEWVCGLRSGGNEFFNLPIDPEECWLRLARHLRFAQQVRQLEADKASLRQQVWTHSNSLRQQEQRQVSLAKENQALQRLVFVDGLTQIGNRRGFNQQIIQLWQQADQAREPISLLLCDIDYFKRYNDTYGHLAGDVCLQTVADILVQGAHRHGDQVFRYGGEEFAIVLPDTDLEGAQQVALNIQAKLAHAQIPHAGSFTKPYISLSIGLCTQVPQQRGLHQPYEALIQGADEALYRAKLAGRDRIVSHSIVSHSSERNLSNDLLGTLALAPSGGPLNSSPEAKAQLPKFALNTAIYTLKVDNLTIDNAP